MNKDKKTKKKHGKKSSNIISIPRQQNQQIKNNSTEVYLNSFKVSIWVHTISCYFKKCAIFTMEKELIMTPCIVKM